MPFVGNVSSDSCVETECSDFKRKEPTVTLVIDQFDIGMAITDLVTEEFYYTCLYLKYLYLAPPS